MFTPFPEYVEMIVQEQVLLHKDDPGLAIKESLRLLRERPDHHELVELLVNTAVSHLVYKVRHQNNKVIKKELGLYGGPAKVNVMASKGVAVACRSTFDYMIGGKTLGALLGEEIPGLLEQQRRVQQGYQLNIKLLEMLQRVVPAGMTVRQALGTKVKGSREPGDAALAELFQQAAASVKTTAEAEM